MKRVLFILFALSFSLVMTIDGYAQRRPRARQMATERPMQQERFRENFQENCLAIEGLTDEQIEAISAMRTTRLEQGVQHQARMDALRAQKRELMVQPNPDMSRVNGLIDQMADIRTAHMKEAAAHRQDIRNLLTEEQRTHFDQMALRPMGRGGMGQGMGFQRGSGMRPQRMHRNR